MSNELHRPPYLLSIIDDSMVFLYQILVNTSETIRCQEAFRQLAEELGGNYSKILMKSVTEYLKIGRWESLFLQAEPAI